MARKKAKFSRTSPTGREGAWVEAEREGCLALHSQMRANDNMKQRTAGFCIPIAAVLSCTLGCAHAVLDESTQQLIVQAERGVPEARHALCYRFSYGKQAPKDYAVAKRWCELGAAAGISSSQTLLAELYYFGRGVRLDYKKAFDLYSVAAQQGHRHAQYMLAQMYVNGQGVAIDQVLGEQWLRRAASSGHSAAQEWLQEIEASSPQ